MNAADAAGSEDRASRPHSLRARLLLGTLGGVLLLWLVATAAVWNAASHELDELLDGHMVEVAALLATHAQDDNDEDAMAQAPRLRTSAKRVMWQIWHDGAIVRRSSSAPATPLGPRERAFASTQIDDHVWRVFSTGRLAGGDTVMVAERTDDRRDILAAIIRNLLWPLLLALPALAVLVVLSVRLSLSPLARIGAALQRRAPLALDPLRADLAPREVLPLVAAINELFGRIRRTIEQEKRFTADASHELRTPIAALRAQAQVALASTDAAQRDEALRATLDSCDRVARLLEQLLTLARLDARDAAPQAAPVDLDALARTVLADAANLTPGRGSDLELDSAGAALVEGEPTLLQVLLRNLVDNALRYSPAGAPVQVQLVRDGDGTTITVEDGGAGLDEAAMARLGERFFRAAPGGPSGTGLGWSIVRRIAALHGATVEVGRSAALGGLRVVVRFGAGSRAAV